MEILVLLAIIAAFGSILYSAYDFATHGE